MISVTNDVIEIDENVDNAEAQITVILADQILQDEKLFELEESSEGMVISSQATVTAFRIFHYLVRHLYRHFHFCIIVLQHLHLKYSL